MLSSTRKHRDTQRANVAVEVLSSAASSISQQAAIPVKISQALISTYSVFTNNLKPLEKCIQVSQAAIAATHAGLLIALALQNDDQCCGSTELLCRLVLVSELAYQGLLVGSYAVSEARKDATPAVLPQSAP